MAAAIAPWFRLSLPSFGCKFESHAHHLSFFKFVLKFVWEKDENKQKEAGIGPFYKNVKDILFPITFPTSLLEFSTINSTRF